MASSKMSLKLIIDRKGGRVLYAEAGKDFVDFLFSVLTLPSGTVIRLLKKKAMVGSISNLYSSIEKLKEEYMQPNINKDTLLKPKSQNVPLLLANKVSTVDKKPYMCRSSHRFVADDPRAICPQCKNKLDKEVPLVAPPKATQDVANGGYVQGLLTYLVTDDLVVAPILSTASGIEILKKFNVNVGDLDEKVVSFGMDEGLKLLKVSMHSKKVLSSIYCDEKRVKQEPRA